MPKLTYWTAECLTDGQCYSILERTKTAALLKRQGRESDFGPVVKRTLRYTDAFDLFDYATSEGGGRSCGDLVGKYTNMED